MDRTHIAILGRRSEARQRQLGFAARRPDNACMHSDHPEHGFQFPGVFEITAMGAADARLEREIPEALVAAGLQVLHETLTLRQSSGARYVSIRLSFRAEDRAQYDAAHVALRAHPQIKWTI